jgi:hypothetical protein
MVGMKHVMALGLVIGAMVLCGGVKEARADFMNANDSLACGDSMYSGNGNYRLSCEFYQDPFCHIYQTWSLTWRYEGPGSTYIVWNSQCDAEVGGAHGLHRDQWNTLSDDGITYMQGDGNLVLYNHNVTSAAWASGTDGNSGAWFNMQDDGNIAVYTSGNSVLWSLY